jgi:hypothetical protein
MSGSTALAWVSGTMIRPQMVSPGPQPRGIALIIRILLREMSSGSPRSTQTILAQNWTRRVSTSWQAYLLSIGSSSRLGDNFVAPSYHELKTLRPYNETNPPSQSKVWLDPDFLRTPTPPPKAASRSHHKKEVDPALEAGDGRRSGRRLPFPERPAVKPSAKGKSKEQERDKDSVKDKEKEKDKDKEEKSHAKQPHLPKRRSSAGLRESASPNRSMSPSAHMHSAARKRITMNSRDSMYEEEVRAAMEASRREALGLSPMPEPAPEEFMEDEEGEKQEIKKGKRKRDREEDESGE